MDIRECDVMVTGMPNEISFKFEALLMILFTLMHLEKASLDILTKYGLHNAHCDKDSACVRT